MKTEIKTRPIGERFEVDGILVEVVEYHPNKERSRCCNCIVLGNYFLKEETGTCRWYARSDKTDVIFKKVGNDEN